MIRSMYSGIGGMKNFQTKLDVIGNNIANVNTFGFKKGRTTFKDLVSQQLAGASNPTDNRGGTNPRQIGLGGTLASVDTIHTQGSLQTTGRALDLGISGDGFFIVNDGNLSYYTRAGNFYLDREGTLVTADGLKVQGYLPDPVSGQIDPNRFGDLKVEAGNVIPPQATTDVSLKGNLNANLPVGATPPEYVYVQYKVTDSLGGQHDLRMQFERTGAGAWNYTAERFDKEIVPPGSPWVPLTTPATGTLNFDSNGALITTGFPIPATNMVLSTAELGTSTNQVNADPVTIPLSVNMFQGLTQFEGSNTADVDQINGNSEGFLESFNISQTGEINGIYTNGEVRILGQMAMATFNNTGGLTKSGDNLFQVSNNSGVPNIGFAGQGRGVIAGSSLEMSNVDLSEEFTEMIVAQRGFQANTRIITTSDEILQELVNLKR
ncbi:flagellar hook protein FlgE [Anaerobacillus isosaccharinicus]|uniref:Flagellar hook protein FlgE n=1 Tax=Anaerobacillus isosaccharinicus TaxID=1532552 RepID=A0A1S2L6T6_9BACI|nr:flagellar hook protein FlgE [Anaerobacillus isosaccharinicus]MBA5587331.1 flagellar hook protein FlgE [Anaerobacillus isosaccharinicus]QOY34475.1 flagellar hook protein FlgE [Anaerobacillus isosaccharinicus]